MFPVVFIVGGQCPFVMERDTMPLIDNLIVSDYGAFIGLKGRRIIVTIPEQAAVDAPLMHLRSVQVLTRSASISAAALAACCHHGIPVHFIDSVEWKLKAVCIWWITRTPSAIMVTGNPRCAPISWLSKHRIRRFWDVIFMSSRRNVIRKWKSDRVTKPAL